MTNDNPPPPPADQPQNPQEPPPPPKKKRHRLRNWSIGIGLVLLLLIVLILLAPTIASTGPVRGMVASQASGAINGHIEIDSYSVGWTTGLRAQGVKIYDDQQRLVLEVERLSTQLTLLEAMRGNLDFGQTEADIVFAVVVDEDGTSNVQRLAKEDEKPAEPDQPAQLPDLRGHFVVNYRGTVEGPGVPAPVLVEPSSAVLTVNDINEAIQNDIKLIYRVGDSPAGTLLLAGNAELIRNNQLDLDRPRIDEKLQLSNVDLGGLAPIIAMFAPDLHARGTANGALDLSASGTSDLAAQGAIRVSSLELSGTALKGDTYRSSSLELAINGGRALREGTEYLVIDTMRVTFDQGHLDVVASAPQQTLMEAAQAIPAALNAAIGQRQETQTITLTGQGQATVNAELDLAAIANQLPNLIKLQENTQITSGQFAHSTKLIFQPNQAQIRTNTDITNVAGTNNGETVSLDPIHVAVGADTIAADQPQLRNVKLEFTSGFASAAGGGESLEQLELDGSFDLGRMQQQAEQFVNVTQLVAGEQASEPVVMRGTGQFRVTTRGELVGDTPGDIAAAMNMTLANIHVSGIAEQPIRQDRLELAAAGNLARGTEHFVEQIRQAVVTLRTGDPQRPIVDAQLNADVNLADNTLPRFELAKLNVTDLRAAQEQFGGFVPALSQQRLQITEGQLSASAAGSYDGQVLQLARPLTVSVQNLTMLSGDSAAPVLQRENIAINAQGNVRLPDETTGLGAELAELSLQTGSDLLQLSKTGQQPLVFSMSSEGAIQGNGQLRLVSNLRRLNDVAQAMGGEVAVRDPDAAQLESGILDATLQLATAQASGTTININGKVEQLTVASGGQQPIQNETVTLAIEARSPAELNTLTAAGTVESTFATATLSDTRLILQTTRNGATTQPGTWEMLQSANVDLQAPDLPRLYALMQALAPPDAQATGDVATTQPAETLPPLQLTGGSASMKLSIARDEAAKVTKLNLTDATIRQLVLARGQQSYAFDRDVVIALAADIAAEDASGEQAPAEQIRSIRVNELAANLGVAELKMPQAIVITDLATTPRAQGAITTTGQLERLTPLLAVLQGGEPLPYAGAFQITQSITSQGDLLALVGDGVTNDFRVFDAANREQVVFSEKQVTIRNDIVADLENGNATIKQLSIAMPQSEALGLDLTGQILDWQTQRRLQDVKLRLAYDLEKLWPIVHPMLLTPGEEDPYQDLQIAGKHSKTFTVAGSYPAAERYQDSIRHLKAAGEFTIDRLITSGFDVANSSIGINLTEGRLETTMQEPAQANGGQLQLGGFALDLTQDQPRLWSVKNNAVLSKVSINPLLGETLGKFVNPVFANSTRAQGLLDLNITQLHGVALGEAMKTADSGTARIAFSLTEMDIANPLGSLIVESIPVLNLKADPGVADTFRGQIRNAVVTLQKGVTTQDITMEIINPRRARDVVASEKVPQEEVYPLRFQGNVQLVDLTQAITFTIPPQLLEKWTGSQDIVEWLPRGLPVSLRGQTTAPKPDFGNIAKQIADAKVKSELQKQLGERGGETGKIIGDILGGRGEQPPPQRQQEEPRRDQPATQESKPPPQKEDPLGGLLREITRPREERQRRE